MMRIALAVILVGFGCSKKPEEKPSGPATGTEPAPKAPEAPPTAPAAPAGATGSRLAKGVDRGEFCRQALPDLVLAKYKLKRTPQDKGPETEDMASCDAETSEAHPVGIMIRCGGGYGTAAYLAAEAQAAGPTTELAGFGDKAYATKDNVMFDSAGCQYILSWLGGDPRLVDFARDVYAAQPH